MNSAPFFFTKKQIQEMIDEGVSDAVNAIGNKENGDISNGLEQNGLADILAKHGREINTENIGFYKANVGSRLDRYNKLQTKLKGLLKNVI